MTVEERLFELEKGFWSGDADYYREHLTQDARMVFPAPVGVLEHAATLQSLHGTPRWIEVHFRDRQLVQLTPDVATLIYRAEARREGDAGSYQAYCSSVYVVRDRAWRLAVHQQTPLSG